MEQKSPVKVSRKVQAQGMRVIRYPVLYGVCEFVDLLTGLRWPGVASAETLFPRGEGFGRAVRVGPGPRRRRVPWRKGGAGSSDVAQG